MKDIDKVKERLISVSKAVKEIAVHINGEIKEYDAISALGAQKRRLELLISALEHCDADKK